MDMKAIASALCQYETVFSEFPKGDNVTIFQALLGSNGQKHCFLEPGRTNNLGELLDPWKTPYKIEIVTDTKFVIQSAGEDQQFGTKDDYILDSTKRDFFQEPKL
jgi:hypothetical protein